MGCDISVHCEYRKDGVWYNCDNFEWDQEYGRYEFSSIYWYRNYELFGVLAGVRDISYGTISEPKGLPEDISPKTKELADEWKGDAHSYSYLTMRELLRWKEIKTQRWKKLKKKYKVTHDESEGDFIYNEKDNVLMYKREKTILDTLIKRMKTKMCDHVYIFEEDDYWNKGDDFRIVFWFDS